MTTLLSANRLLVTTWTGSRYAFARTHHGMWWVRPRAKPTRGSIPPLPDEWRRIEMPTPWPPRRNARMRIGFVDDRVVPLCGHHGLWIEEEWRITSVVRRIQRWNPSTSWPGAIPVDEERGDQ